MSWIKLNATTPAAPAGAENVHFRKEAGHTGLEDDPIPVSAWAPKVLPDEVAVNDGASDTATTEGNFKVAHGLGYAPSFAVIQMTSLGQIVFQPATRYDATYFYLQGSFGGLTANVEAWR